MDGAALLLWLGQHRSGGKRGCGDAAIDGTAHRALPGPALLLPAQALHDADQMAVVAVAWDAAQIVRMR